MLRSEPLWSWKRAAIALAWIALGSVLWPVLQSPSEALFRGLANTTLGPLTFGTGGHVLIMPARSQHGSTAAYEENDSWSTALELRVDDVAESVRINPRRLLYLPCVVLSALVLASPLAPRRKLIALGIGMPLLAALAVLSTWLTAVWLFARVPGLIYTLRPLEQRALDFSYEAWVTGLGNRFIAAIVIAAALILTLSSDELRAGPRRAKRGQSERQLGW